MNMKTITGSLKEIYERELGKVAVEIGLYTDEKMLWAVDKDIANPGGNLCLHLVGNLNHFVGAVLGNIGYVRERDAEFTTKNIPQKELQRMVGLTESIVSNVFCNLEDSDLAKQYPVDFLGQTRSTGFVLIHLAGHLSYHLGQINYHRRLLDGVSP